MTRQGTARSAELSWKLTSVQVHHPEGHVVNLQKSHMNPSHFTYHFYVSFPEGIELHIPSFPLGPPSQAMADNDTRPPVQGSHMAAPGMRPRPPKVKFRIVRTN